MMGAQRNYLLDMIDIPYGGLRHACYPKTVPSRSHNLHFRKRFRFVNLFADNNLRDAFISVGSTTKAQSSQILELTL